MRESIYKVFCWLAVIVSIPVLIRGQSVFLAVALAVVAFHPFVPWFKKLLPEEKKGERSVKATATLSAVLLLILGAVFGGLAWSAHYGLSRHSNLVDQMQQRYEEQIGQQHVDTGLSLIQSLATDLLPLLPAIAVFIFLAWEYPKLRAMYVERFVDGDRSDSLCDFEDQGITLRKFWGARTLGGFLTGLTVGLVLWFMDMPLAWLWGMSNFLLNYIPTIGSVLGVTLPIGFSMVIDGGPDPLYVAAVVGSIQLLYGAFVDPLLQDAFLPLSSLTVFVAILFWGWMWGPWGALIGVPLTYTLGRLSLHHPVYQAFGKLVLQDLKSSKHKEP